MKLTNPSRRQAILKTVTALAAFPFIKIAAGAETDNPLPHLSEDNPTAVALKYKHDATQAPRVERSGVAAKDQFCHNCNFIQSDEGQWRPCQIFPGKAVNADGWCASWAKKLEQSTG